MSWGVLGTSELNDYPSLEEINKQLQLIPSIEELDYALKDSAILMPVDLFEDSNVVVPNEQLISQNSNDVSWEVPLEHKSEVQKAINEPVMELRRSNRIPVSNKRKDYLYFN